MISIVTGTLNRLNLLKNVISNTIYSCDKLELVLVDGGSTDGTIEYIKNLNDPNIKLIEVGKRSSYPHFMNLGIKNSTYEWVCQWNDDVLLYNKWDEIIDYLNSDVDYFLFNWKYGVIESITNKKWLDGDTNKHGWCLFDDTEKNGEICMNYGIYNKRVFEKIGMYNNEYNYYYADADMSYRSHYFGFTHKSLRNIKVCSIYTTKIAEHHNSEFDIYKKNINLYKYKILPNNLEFL